MSEGWKTPCKNWINEYELDESQKLQLKFEYDIYLLNYTIKIKNLKNLKKPKLGFRRILAFLKLRWVSCLKHTSTALTHIHMTTHSCKVMLSNSLN